MSDDDKDVLKRGEIDRRDDGGAAVQFADLEVLDLARSGCPGKDAARAGGIRLSVPV